MQALVADTIYLDMDGVLFDLVGGYAAEHGLARPALVDALQRGLTCWDGVEALGRSSKHFASLTREFWAELEPTRWLEFLIGYCEGFEALGGTYLFLSSPCSAASAAGKFDALERHGLNTRKLILCPSEHKARLARPGVVLIDDWERNVDEFRAAGGQAVLWPTEWNEARAHYNNPAEILRITYRS